MRRGKLGVALGAVVVVTAVGLLAAQAPSPSGSSPASASQGPAPAPQAPSPAASTPATAPQGPATASQPASQRPSFRGGVDVVSLNVTVTDQSRNFVTSLEQ